MTYLLCRPHLKFQDCLNLSKGGRVLGAKAACKISLRQVTTKQSVLRRKVVPKSGLSDSPVETSRCSRIAVRLGF